MCQTQEQAGTQRVTGEQVGGAGRGKIVTGGEGDVYCSFESSFCLWIRKWTWDGVGDKLGGQSDRGLEAGTRYQQWRDDEWIRFAHWDEWDMLWRQSCRGSPSCRI